MICPQCRKNDDLLVELAFHPTTHDARSVTSKIRVYCPRCGFEGGPYDL